MVAGRLALVIAALPACAALIDATWQLSLSIGRVGASASTELPPGWRETPAPAGSSRSVYYYNVATKETTWTRPKVQSLDPAMFGPPLAMFTPGGGRAQQAPWLGKEWGRSGTQLLVPLELEFFGDDAAPQSDEPLKRTQARTLFTRSSSAERLDVKTSGVAWGMVELSSIQALLVWSIDLPEGANGPPDVTLPANTRLYCSTQVWKGAELDRLKPLLRTLRVQRAALPANSPEGKALDERIKKLERGLPRPGAPTIAVPGSAASSPVEISSHGQLSIQRVAPSGKLVNPFENGGKVTSLNPFAKVSEFGVVGSFVLSPEGDRGHMLESEGAQEVDAAEAPEFELEAAGVIDTAAE